MARSAIKVASENDVTLAAGETLDFDDDNLRGEISQLKTDSFIENMYNAYD